MLCVTLCVNLSEMLCVVLCVSLSDKVCVMLCELLWEMLCMTLSLLRNLLVTFGNLYYFMCWTAFHINYKLIAKPYQNIDVHC